MEFFQIIILTIVAGVVIGEHESGDHHSTKIKQEANFDNESDGMDDGLIDDLVEEEPQDSFGGKHVLNAHDERYGKYHRYDLLYREIPNGDNSQNVLIDDVLISNEIEEDVPGENDDQPFFIASLDDVINKFNKWTEKIPRVHPFYAIKCNDDPNVAKVLASLGAGFDAASIDEIDQVLTMGVKPSKIIFANPIKTEYQLKYAKRRGIKYMTFDTEAELEKIARIFPEAKVVIRLKVKDDGSEFHLGDKFGVSLGNQEKLIKKTQELGLNLAGIAFHVGSNQRDETAYSKAIEMARNVYDKAVDLGIKTIHVLDIGGGYPGDIDFDNDQDLFYKMANEINRALDEHFPKDKFSNLKIIAEPGRYFPTTAFALVMKIIGKRPPDEDNPSIGYFVNNGLYQNFLLHLLEPEQLDKIKPWIPENDGKVREKKKAILWGQTCASLDYLVKDKEWPEMDIGEHFLIKQYGAYTYSFFSEFNGFQRPIVKYVISEHNKKFLE